jgi:pheromone shutdown protein TraB
MEWNVLPAKATSVATSVAASVAASVATSVASAVTSAPVVSLTLSEAVGWMARFKIIKFSSATGNLLNFCNTSVCVKLRVS